MIDNGTVLMPFCRSKLVGFMGRVTTTVKASIPGRGSSARGAESG